MIGRNARDMFSPALEINLINVNAGGNRQRTDIA